MDITNIEITKSYIINTLRQKIDKEENTYRNQLEEILTYVDNHIQNESITIFRFLPYHQHLIGKFRHLVYKIDKTETRIVNFIEYKDGYSVLHFSVPIKLD